MATDENQPDLPVDVATWLAGGGLPVVAEATAALDAGEDPLSVGTRLRTRLAPSHAAAAVAAAVARRRARDAGVAAADRLLFTRRGLEQASRWEVARYRARRFAGADTPVDLCAGVGLDTIALGETTGRVVALDRDPSRVILLAHNVRACGVDAAAVVADATSPPLRTTGFVHADPSRRQGDRRSRSLDAYGPPVEALLAATTDASGRGIVVSPGVSWDDPGLPADAEVEFLQVGGDLVEAMLWLGDLRRGRARSTASILPDGVSRTASTRPPELPVAEVGPWLVEVAPAGVRARLHDELGAEIGASRIARRRALLTTPDDPGPSPWWRRWRVEAVLPPRPRDARRWLRTAAPLPLEIATHGMDSDPSIWWRALGSTDRGPGGRRFHLVRTDDGAVCIATRWVA